MPVVEAIRRLERDGFVTLYPKWGASVKEWTREERLEAYCIRRALEGEAARFFVLRATPEDKRRLQELNEQFDKWAVVGDAVRCDEADVEFHSHIARCTRFPRLLELIENSKIETATIFGLSLVSVDSLSENFDYRRLVGCHQPIVDALLSGDPEAATRAIWRHIDSVLEILVDLGDKDERSADSRIDKWLSAAG